MAAKSLQTKLLSHWKGLQKRMTPLRAKWAALPAGVRRSALGGVPLLLVALVGLSWFSGGKAKVADEDLFGELDALTAELPADPADDETAEPRALPAEPREPERMPRATVSLEEEPAIDSPVWLVGTIEEVEEAPARTIISTSNSTVSTSDSTSAPAPASDKKPSVAPLAFGPELPRF